MTDNEIIKRLERCVRRGNKNYNTDIVLDLINRQKAEIERLQIRVKGQKHSLFEQQAYTAQLQKQLATAKSEAIKEFAEKLKAVCQWLPLTVIPNRFVTIEQIDDLVKEMEEESNDRA